ncbi:hypothetical protein F183_A11710 [Bryobacterales bacterium F-183]|nr:hypothetical protein F183_A11710 [Bryobacterales bacterium F-183]
MAVRRQTNHAHPAKAWAAAAMLAALVGGLCFVILKAHNQANPEVGAGDFKWALRAMRDLLGGRDPYGYAPGPYAIPYPLPSAFAALPVAWMPDIAAGSVFFGLSVLLLAYCVFRSGEEWRLAMLLSWNFVYALLWVQWTPLLCCLWFLPQAMPLLLMKPNIAIPIALARWLPHIREPRFLWRWSWVPLAVLAASLICKPDWPAVWLHQTSTYQGIKPPILVLPLGPLVLLSLLAWPDRRALLIVLMACMPQRMVYDQLPLLLAAGSRGQMWLLVAASWVNCAVFWNTEGGWSAVPMGWQNFIVLTLYLPAVAVVIWPKVRAWASPPHPVSDIV